MPNGAKNWCFTINNPDETSVNELNDLTNECSYLIYQRERGENNTPHLQGYVMLRDRHTRQWLSNKLKRAFLTVARGNPRQNKEYCTKQEGRLEEPVEFGNCPQAAQGRRSDLQAVVETIQAGKNLKEIAEDHPVAFIKQSKGIMNYYNITMEPRNSKTQVVILHGVTGAGKSHLANLFPNTYVVPEATSAQWYNGYDPRMHETVILDDFYGNIKFHTMLKLMDKYEYQVNTQAGS